MVLFRTIYAFDYDEEAGAISNRRTAVKNDPSFGVSYNEHQIKVFQKTWL